MTGWHHFIADDLGYPRDGDGPQHGDWLTLVVGDLITKLEWRLAAEAWMDER